MQALLTSVIDGSEWRLYPRVRDFKPIEQEAGCASEIGLDGFGNFHPSPSFETPTIRPMASRYADWAIPPAPTIPPALSKYQMHFKRISTTYRINYYVAKVPIGPRPPHYQGFTITLRHATLGRPPLYD